MRKSFAWMLTLVLVGLAGCETTKPKPESKTTYRGASFEVSLPPTVTAVAEQGDGYAVHYFRIKKSQCQMGVYEGQRPHLFSKKEKNLTVMRRGTTSRENIERGDDVWGVDSNSMVWRESVWDCRRLVRGDKGKAYRLPSMIHIWYFGATEEEAEVFDSIADSIQMVE